MNDFFRQLGDDGMRIWNQMSMFQRMLVGAVAAATVGLLIFLVVWAQSPTYGVLFSRLSDQDAGAIIGKLKEQSIAYTVDGTAIKVPQNQVHEVRLSLAAEGLPSGGTVGFQELFNGQNWSATDFERKLNFQRGLEGELSRTIGAIEGVEKARVHIVIPKESLFIEDEQDTTASVLLTLHPMAKLEPGQIKTIQHLVAKAVPRLGQDKVFVTDTAGRDYTEELARLDPKNLAGTDLSSRHLEIKRKFERDLERRIQAMLDPVLGTENSVVRVNTNWDFSQVETNAETYTPSAAGEGGILLSEKYKRETYNGVMAGNGGVPGEVSNVPDYQAANESGAGNYTNDEGTRNYNINKEVQRRIKEPAVLRDTSVSVAFNPTGRNLTPQGVQRQADNIARMVALAAGIEVADIPDKVFVNPMQFNNAAEAEAARAAEERARQEAITKWATVGAAIALSLLAFALLLASFRRRQKDEIAQIEEAMPKLPSDDLGITLIDEDDDLLGTVSDMDSLPPPTPDEQRISDIQKELTSFIKSHPKDAAKLVRAWMVDEG